MPWYSNKSSTIALVFSFYILEVFPACFSYRNIFNLSQSSLGYSEKKIVEVPKAMIAGDWNNRENDLCPAILVPKAFSSKTIPLRTQTLVFYTVK